MTTCEMIVSMELQLMNLGGVLGVLDPCPYCKDNLPIHVKTELCPPGGQAWKMSTVWNVSCQGLPVQKGSKCLQESLWSNRPNKPVDGVKDKLTILEYQQV